MYNTYLNELSNYVTTRHVMNMQSIHKINLRFVYFFVCGLVGLVIKYEDVFLYFRYFSSFPSPILFLFSPFISLSFPSFRSLCEVSVKMCDNTYPSNIFFLFPSRILQTQFDVMVLTEHQN